MEVRTRKPVLKPSSKRKRKSAHPPLLAAAGAKGGNQPPKPTPGRCSTPRAGRGVGRRAQEACPFCIQLPVRLRKSLEQGCTPGRRAQWLKAFLFWDVALPARPFPLPHVVQVRDTWRRGPIGSFKPRRGSGGGGGRLGRGRRGGRQWLDEWRGEGEGGRGGRRGGEEAVVTQRLDRAGLQKGEG